MANTEGVVDNNLKILVPNRTIDSFKGNYARALLYIDRYALKDSSGEVLETDWEQSAKRISSHIASVEKDSELWSEKFSGYLKNFDLVPAGRIIAGAGSGHDVTLFNCFVLGIDDNRNSILETLQRAVEIQARGGGVGFNFSNIRPSGSKVYSVGGKASGPCSFISMYNAAFRTISQGGSRRGATMGVLDISHPDVLEFVRYKYEHRDEPNGTDRPSAWEMFNVSVAINNEFIHAVDRDLKWDLKFEGKVYETVRAKNLWEEVCKYAWLYGDPGIINLENINKDNPGAYFEYLESTNPCFTGDTEVLLADGTSKSLRELSVSHSDTKFQVLSINKEGMINLGWAHSPRMTGENKELLAVKLDNENIVRCTPEHKFITMSGEWVEARNLSSGDMLMPLHSSLAVGDAVPSVSKLGELTSPLVKVSSVDSLEGKEDVYCLTVEDLGNFCLKSGVFVSNCSEIPLPRNGVCNLASINLGNFVGSSGGWDYERLQDVVQTGVRFLDDVLSCEGAYPFDDIREVSQGNRRIGLSTIGVADALLKMEIRYGSEEAVDTVRQLTEFIRDTSYSYSADLAAEKGMFPKCEPKSHVKSAFVSKLPADIKKKISKNGVRNVCILTGVPGGSISILAGASSGIEPVFGFVHNRYDGTGKHKVYHPIYKDFIEKNPDTKLPDYFVDASQVTPLEHSAMQIAFQDNIDNAISKTINLPNDATERDVSDAFMSIARYGKSVTVFRDGSRSAVLTKDSEDAVVEANSKIQFTKPETPLVLPGHRFKIKSPEANYYIQITQIEKNGEKHPYELFVTTLDGRNFEWLSALSVAMTAMLKQHIQYGVPIDFIFDDLKRIQSPTNGFWVKLEEGRSIYAPSIPAAIIMLLSKYREDLKELPKEEITGEVSLSSASSDPVEDEEVSTTYADECPQCGQKSYVRVGNCYTCHNLGCMQSTCK